ncbi:hypothetical protein [Leifsonia virtsii]|uniref:Uncharacterized protein n=1 Tax=Leifsonia virtsii TaxID=3035915 RepID=A0ABT8IWV6_9MICO|nr:hypothetical protein [Leifsonia virtsii]MDN4596881.1 hypothetical protein [Leifsonia virtsii]
MTEQPTFDPRRASLVRRMLVENAEGTIPGPPSGFRRVALVVALVIAALGLSTGGVALAMSGVLRLPESQPPVAATSAPPSLSPSPTATATATPTPPPAPAMTDDPATWVIGFGTVGPLSVGMAAGDADSVMGGYVLEDQDECPVRYYTRDGAPLVALTYGTDGRTVDSIQLGLGIKGVQGPPLTAAGIGIGSTREELLAAYPDIATHGSYFGVFDNYAITDGNGNWIVFAAYNDTGIVRGIQVGTEETVRPEICG